jgi:hypothetical protein
MQVALENLLFYKVTVREDEIPRHNDYICVLGNELCQGVSADNK